MLLLVIDDEASASIGLRSLELSSSLLGHSVYVGCKNAVYASAMTPSFEIQGEKAPDSTFSGLRFQTPEKECAR